MRGPRCLHKFQETHHTLPVPPPPQGLAGEYGVTKNHSPVIAELKAGVVQIVHEPGQAPEKYFVSGGFALTHANSVTVRCGCGEILPCCCWCKCVGWKRRKKRARKRLVSLTCSIKGTLSFCLSHPSRLLTHNDKQDIAVVEAAKLEDIDLEEVPKIYAEAMKDFNSAPEGSKARVEAQIEVEVAKSLASALGVVLV